MSMKNKAKNPTTKNKVVMVCSVLFRKCNSTRVERTALRQSFFTPGLAA